MNLFRTLILNIFAILVAGCAPVVHIPSSIETFGYDFRPYSEQGFMFTMDKYLGEYESRGWVGFRFTPETNLRYRAETGDHIGHLRQVTSVGKWYHHAINRGALLDSLYVMCRDLGADALAELSIETDIVDVKIGKDEFVRLPEITMQGFAIRRLN